MATRRKDIPSTSAAAPAAPAAPAGSERFEPRALALATVIALVGSVAASLLIRTITVSIITVPSQFHPLAAPSVVMLTILGVLAAAGACLLLNAVSKRPRAAFRRIAPIALVVSFVPDFAIWASHAYSHTASAKTVIPLLVMHVAVAAVCLTVLPRRGAGSTSRA